MKNICELLLLKMSEMYSWNWENLFIRSFNFTFKDRFFQHQYQKQEKMYFMIGFPWSLYLHTIFLFGVVRNKLQRLNISNQSKEDQKFKKKNISCESASNFDQWKTFSENYKPMRVWLWLVYKFTENYCRSRLFSEFIQTQRKYPTSLDKIRILTWKLLVISS